MTTSLVDLANERYEAGWISDNGETITDQELLASASYWPVGYDQTTRRADPTPAPREVLPAHPAVQAVR